MDEFKEPETSTKRGIPGWVWAVVGGVVTFVVVVIPLTFIVVIGGLTLLGTSLNAKFATVAETVQYVEPAP